MNIDSFFVFAIFCLIHNCLKLKKKEEVIIAFLTLKNFQLFVLLKKFNFLLEFFIEKLLHVYCGFYMNVFALLRTRNFQRS